MSRSTFHIEGTKFPVLTGYYSLKWLHSIKDPKWPSSAIQLWSTLYNEKENNILPDALSRFVHVIDAVTSSVDSFESSSDPWYLDMCRKLPESPTKYPLWWLEDGELYKRALSRYPDRMSSEDPCLIVAPKEQRPTIIKTNHDLPTSWSILNIFQNFTTFLFTQYATRCGKVY